MKIISQVHYMLRSFRARYCRTRLENLGFVGKNVDVQYPMYFTNPANVFLYDDTNIFSGATILTHTGKFIMKKHSGAAQGLTVVTGNHYTKVGGWFKDYMRMGCDDEKDVVVEEDVWIGTNVTLLAGTHLGRGCVVGGGAVVRGKVPPYAVVIGNPAKIVGFKFTPEEVLQHEKVLYPESERLSLDILDKNYDKYFLKRIKDIKHWISL